MKRQERAAEIIRRLQKIFPNPVCALTHKNPFELLIATILSAQCTDERVNMVTPELFRKFPTPDLMSSASIVEIEKLIHSTGFFRAKAKNIKQCALTLVQNFRGSVPETMDELITLAGVGRKTANVLLGNAFAINVGVVVDTHVKRLSRRLGLTKSETPEKIEQDLMKLFLQKDWTLLSHLLILHGRGHCDARRPDCENCPLADLCPSRDGVLKKLN